MAAYKILLVTKMSGQTQTSASWLTFEAKANFTGFSTTERDLQVRQYWVIPVKPFQLKLVLNLEIGLHTWLVPWKVTSPM